MKSKDIPSDSGFIPNQNNFESKGNALMTVEEVSQYLRLKPETVRSMVRRRKIPAIKIGRVWRFKRELIAEWIQKESKRFEDDEEHGILD